MVSPDYATILTRLFIELDLLLKNYVFNGYSALANALKYPLGLAITIYIIFLGISMIYGWVQFSLGNLIKVVLKISIIYTLAINWSFFSEYFVKLIYDGSAELSCIISSAASVPLPHFAGEGINGSMQSVLIEITKVGCWIWNSGSWNHVSPYFTAILTWIFGYGVILIAVFEIILAKIMLAILLSMAPLFVSFTVFKPTHGFFDRWLGAIIGFALLMIFVSGVLALTLSLTQWVIADDYAQKAVHFTLVGFVPMMVVGFLGMGIIARIAHLAENIGGTISTISSSSLLATSVSNTLVGDIARMKLPRKMLSNMKQRAKK